MSAFFIVLNSSVFIPLRNNTNHFRALDRPRNKFNTVTARLSYHHVLRRAFT